MTTARELYDCDDTFRLLVDEWVRERRCPMPLVDRCLDFGLESQADCARWAATEPDRKQFTRDEKIGPFPWDVDPNRFKWTPRRKRVEDSELYAHRVPDENYPDSSSTHEEASAVDAILWLLDNWLRS